MGKLSCLVGMPLVAVCVIATFVLRSVKLWTFTVDDTFITLRYAKHLANGIGLAWNQGELPVEGYTSFSWTLLMVVPHWLGADAEQAAKLASSLLVGSTVIVAALSVARLARVDSRLRLAGALTASGFVALDPASVVHAVSGMDTALFALLTTLLLTLLCVADGSRRRAAYLALGVTGLLTGITRPEGNLLFLTGVLVLLIRSDKPTRAVAVRSLLLAYVLPAAAYYVWRLSVYELLFPLPLYAKAVSTGTFWAGREEAWAFAHDLVVRTPLLAGLMVLGIRYLGGRATPALCAMASLYVASFKPAPLMAYEHRYLFPIVPWLSVLAGLGTIAALDWAATKRTRGSRALQLLPTALVTFLLASTVFTQRRHLEGSYVEFLAYGLGLQRAHIRLGKTLHPPQSGTTPPSVALLDAGAVAYHSDWTVIDTFGLNDRHIALHGRGDPSYVLGRKPELIVLVSREAERYVPVFAYEAPLFEASRKLGYTEAHSYPFTPDYHLRVLRRSDVRVPLGE